MRRVTWVLVIGLVATPVIAAEPVELKTLMTERGKLLAGDDFAKGLGDGWKASKGKWENVDGALKGVELKDDMHAAVVRRKLAFHNCVVQYSFKLDGAKQTTFSINGSNGHVCRVLVKPDGFTVQKDDQDGKDGTDKAVRLDACKVDIKPGEWHTLVIEVNGMEMLARLDDKHVAFGSHDSIDVDKANIGLTLSGDSASFKNLKVWEASPNKGWEATKAKLLEERKPK